MNVPRIAKIIMPLLLLAMLNCRPASAEISVDGDWGKACFYVFRPDASTLQFRQGPHKAVLRNFNSGVELQGRVYRLEQGPLAGFQSAVGVVKKFKKYGRLFLEYTDYDADAQRLKGRQDNLTTGLRIDF